MIKMNLRLYIICIAALLALVTPALAGGMATIYGTVYNGETFEPLENAVVEVNSTPSQSMVATYGFYSFDLEPGNYLLTARYYENNTLIYSTQKTVEIKEEGKYKIALLLLPVYPEELMGSSERNLTSGTLYGNAQSRVNDGNSSENFINKNEMASPPLKYMLIALFLFSLFAGGYKLSIKSKRADEGRGPGTKTQYRVETEHKQRSYEPSKMPGLSAKNSENLGPEAAKSITTEAYPEANAQTEESKVLTTLKIAGFEGANSAKSQDSKFEFNENNKEKESKTVPEGVMQPGIELESEAFKEPQPSVREPIIKPEQTFSGSEETFEPEKKGLTENLETQVLQNESLKPETEETLDPEFAWTIEDISLKPEGPIEERKPEVSEKSQETSQEKVSLEPSENKLEKGSSEAKAPVSKKKAPLPADLQEVMDIIRGQGGRITQKNLRSRLKYSEGKVSLMLADLERRELIEKFKRGRGNIVIVRDEER